MPAAFSNCIRELRGLFFPNLRIVSHSIREKCRPREFFKALPFIVMVLAFWATLFVVTTHVLNSFSQTEVVGELLVARLMSLLFITIFFALIFSNIVTALSTFFLSDDLNLILTAPVDWLFVFYQRFALTLFHSSWMVMSFILPVFASYGFIFRPGAAYYLALVLVLSALFVLCAAVGVGVVLLLVNVFPARKTMDMLVLLGIIGFCGIYLLFRLAGPAGLVNPEQFVSLKDYFLAFQVPSSVFLPNYWAVRGLSPFLFQLDGGDPYFYIALLFSTAAALLVLVSWLFERTYFQAWTKAQEARPSGALIGRLVELLFRGLRCLVPRSFRHIVMKDIKFFFRDASQWSQLLLLGALIAVYLYNFRPLGKIKDVPFVHNWLQYLIVFANLALATLVIAAVSLRFVFPSISLEGRAMWILKSSPLSMKRLVMSKFFMAAFPLLMLAETLIVVSNRMIDVSPFLMNVSAACISFLTLAVVSMGIGFGAMFPRFKEENVAKIASSYGGIMYMVSCVGLMVAVIGLVGWPTFLLDRKVALLHRYIGHVWAGYAGAFVLLCAAIAFPLWWSVRALERLEV